MSNKYSLGEVAVEFAHGLSQLVLKESTAKGKVIEIPSLGIYLSPKKSKINPSDSHKY